MDLLSTAKDLISIYQDIQHRISPGISLTLYDFDQTWASTALGFGGVGGSAMTTARTYVLMPSYVLKPHSSQDWAIVYFGGRFAYKTPINDRFREDLKNHRMASVAEAGRYMK